MAAAKPLVQPVRATLVGQGVNQPTATLKLAIARHADQQVVLHEHWLASANQCCCDPRALRVGARRASDDDKRRLEAPAVVAQANFSGTMLALQRKVMGPEIW
jgi:hypothetical protein